MLERPAATKFLQGDSVARQSARSERLDRGFSLYLQPESQGAYRQQRENTLTEDKERVNLRELCYHASA